MSTPNYNEVILVDEADKEIGTMDKLEAHQRGLLHRAFSILIFNDNDELLLQQRAMGKYHSEGLWTNTCCSHPAPGESILTAAHRRLKEEMGFDCAMNELFHFTYKAELDNNLTEHELDHVVIGRYNGIPELNPLEVLDFKWMSLTEIRNEMANNQLIFTSWFKIIIQDHFEQLTASIAHESL